MFNNSSKFYSRSLTLLLPILKMINDNFSLTKISEVVNIKKSHVSYYVKKAKLIGYVNEVLRDKIKILELTQPGKNFIAQYETKSENEKEALNQPICRLENIRFKAHVIRMPAINADWKKVEMNNWSQYGFEVDSIRIHLNHGDTPSIEFIPSAVDGDDPYKLHATVSL
jgi:predicted transcriptional regulator